MENANHTIEVRSLREDIREPILHFARSVLASLAANMDSISVVGSSLTADFVSGRSDINTAIVFRKDLVASLDAIVACGRSVRKQRFAPPLLLTADYLARSRDTFPIELLDFQLNHCTIFGSDPFASLVLSKKDVRLQCERELKSILIRLSQGYIVSGGQTKPLSHLLVSAVVAMVPLLRAMLWLKNLDRSGSFEDVFTKASSEFRVKAAPLAEIRGWKSAGRVPSKETVSRVFPAAYNLVSGLADVIDAIEV